VARSRSQAVGRPCAARPAGGSIGWLVLVGVLAFVVVLGLGWFATSESTGSVPQHTVQVQVHPGETLWGIAERLAPNDQPAAVVDRIRQLNGLAAADQLYPGELLQVPSAN
jgi:predicted Zn-dependent protease